MNIVLTGFMGTGKTVVGKRLARWLGWRFVDIDQLIEERAHMSIARIFTERGEVVFRRLERRCISRAIRDRQQVIATGAGAFVDPQNRARLRVSGPVICLTARPRTILTRVGHRIGTRPMLAGSANPLSKIRSLLSQRAGAYAQADLTIDTNDLSVDEVTQRLWETLSPYLCKSWQYLLDHAGELAQRYGGKYIVVVDNRIVASGDTQLEAYQNARLRPETGRGKQASERLIEKRDAGIYYIPLPEELLTAL
jgi:shikimate kinase